jgi:hypothetical protein
VMMAIKSPQVIAKTERFAFGRRQATMRNENSDNRFGGA